MKYTIEQLRAAWLASALELWESGVVDVHQSEAIKQMFRACGWGFWVDDKDGYRNNAKHAWCGIFQAYAALNVGRHLADRQCVAVGLDPEIANHCLPSTQRMQSVRKWEAAGVTMPTMWVMDGTTGANPEYLEPGMVATIAARDYGDARNKYGGHFVLIESYDPATQTVNTVEGNAKGELGNGNGWGEGVVRRRGKHARKLSDFRRIYEFGTEHFEDMAP